MDGFRKTNSTSYYHYRKPSIWYWYVKIGLICSLSIFNSTNIFGQGPLSGFLNGRGKTDVALNYATDRYENYLFGNEKRPISTKTQSVNLFLEHGLSDSLSLVLTLPFVWTNPDSANFQDATLFLKYRNQYQKFKAGALSFLTGVGLSFPVGNYRLDAERPIGTRSTIFQGRIITQYNFYHGLFFHLQGGVDLRVNPDSQVGVPVLFRVGWGTHTIYGEAWVEWRSTFNSAVDTRISGGAGSDWLRVGATIYYPITKKMGITIAVAKFITGRNIGLSTLYSGGIVQRIDWNKMTIGK